MTFPIVTANGPSGYNLTRSLRFRSSASAYLNRTPASAGNRQTWTWSGWIKRGAFAAGAIFQTYGPGGFGIQGSIELASDTIDFIFDYNAGSRWRLSTTAVYRDPSSWYHIIVVANTTSATSTDRLQIYVNGARVTAFGTANYPTQNANGTLNQAYAHGIGARTDASAPFDGYMAEVNFIDGQALTPSSFGSTNTLTGVWQPAPYTGTYGTNGFYLPFTDNSGATATTIGKDFSGNGNNWTPNNINVQHTLGSYTITIAKVYSTYSGGTRAANFSVQYSDNNISWTTAFSGVMSSSNCGLFSGSVSGDGSYGSHRYWRYVVGSTVTGHHPRVSRIILGTGSLDVNIIVFNSDNCADIGDIPTNGTSFSYDFATSNSSYDSMTDVPTLTSPTAANFCVGNPLYVPSVYSQMSSRYANLDWGQASTNVNCSMASTLAMPTGKWYWEVTVGAALTQAGLGMQNTTNTAWRGGGTVLYLSGGNKQIGGGTATSYGASYTTNDIIGFAYNGDTGELTCYKNNVSQGVIYSSGTGSSWLPCIHDDNAGAGVTYYHSLNFGQRPFAYTPPTGFVALNTYNLPTSTIVKGNTVMDATLWTGNNSTQTITNAGAFKPDLVWIKSRNVNGYYHVLTDSVRGITKALFSNATNAEDTQTTRITALNSNGFSLGSYGDVNESPQTYVGWQWQAGQGTTSTNTNGTITSSVSVNASAGFSVVTYTGNASIASFGHGLGVAPKFIVIKNRSTSGSGSNWCVGADIPNFTWSTDYLYLNSSIAKATDGGTTQFYSAPTSTVVNIGGGTNTNGSGNAMVAYCWTPIAGYSSFGTYTGNGSTDGPFVYLGFKPKWVLLKRTDSAADWIIYDAVRNTYNVTNLLLFPDTAGSEETSTANIIDILSNGFKLRGSAGGTNGSGGTWIYAAFASNPFKNSLAQ